jgi:CheY-like chemotaxis protein
MEPLGRLRILLAGDAAARPDGLERALTRAGFLVAEAVDPTAGGGPDAVLLTLAGADQDRLRALLPPAPEDAPPRVVTFVSEDRDAPAAALALGADDALASPIHFPELCARLMTRIRDRQAPVRTGYENRIRESVRELIAESRPLLRPEEIVLALIGRLARAFGLAHCSFVMVSPAEQAGRVMADLPQAGAGSDRLDLTRYPEIAEALRSGRPVTMPSIWPGAGTEAAPNMVAVPVLPPGGVSGVLLLATRPSEPRLNATQLALAVDLAAAAAQALGPTSVARPDARGRNDRASLATPDTLERRLHEEFERARRYSLSFSLVLLGPEPGSGPEPPEELQRRLRRELRLPDFVSRYGTQEFAIVLPETDADGARRSVARLRERLGEAMLDSGESAPSPFSAGIATYPHPAVAQPDDLFALVEAALMRGKAQSGERVGVAE